jgi:hypothetical protein
MNPILAKLRLSKMLAWSSGTQFVCHQIGWWACVMLMGWQGPLVMAGFIAMHFYMTRAEWRGETLIALVSILVGLAVDNSLYALGAVRYVGEMTVGFSPVWLVAIWAGFGATLRHYQSIFVRKWTHAMLVGTLGGPIAYYGGVKLERFTVGGVEDWLCVSLVWTLAMMTLFGTVRWIDKGYLNPAHSPSIE